MTHPHDRLSDGARARLGTPGHPTWEQFYANLLLRTEVRQMQRGQPEPDVAADDLEEMEVIEDLEAA